MEVKIIFIIINLVVILCKDVSENERTTRAAFVQRLLNKNKYLEGKIKLAGGSKEYEGNVYIYHAGRWGSVCDDSWDAQAAKVVCRIFNKTGVPTHGGQFGEATEKYWMDDVVCEGDENSITQCIFAGWGSSDCENSEIAGVICNDDTQNIIPVIVKKDVERQIHEVIDLKKTSLRLVGGRNSKEGRIEIYHNGIWGSLCPDGWTLYEASAVCRHLALGFAEQALQTDYFGSSRVILSGVNCEGNESNLFMCKHRELGQVYCPGDAGHVAAVVCTQNLADLYLDSSAIAQSAHLHDVPMYQLQCAMEENCLSKSAYEVQKTNPNWQFETRRLLRFTASSLNIGNAEFRPYLPKHLWQWHLCHMYYIHAWSTKLSIAATSHVELPTMITIVDRLIPNSLEGRCNNKSQPKQKTYCYLFHIKYVSLETVVAVLRNSNGDTIFSLISKTHYHSMEVFATFDILDTTGRRVAEGHKASFCLEDNTCLPGVEKKYSCKNYGDQGVSVNCSDIYLYSIDCQWVDVTDVEPGDYTFKVAVNPHARVAEQSFHNNAASCILRLTDTYAFVHSCNMQRP